MMTVASVISPLLGIGLPIASAATHDGACSSADTKGNATTYQMTVGGGTITQTPTGFETQSTSGHGKTTYSCAAIGQDEITDFTTIGSNSVTYEDGASGSCDDSITLTKNPTVAGTTTGSLQVRVIGGGGGGGNHCQEQGSAQKVSITVNAGKACTQKKITTYTMVVAGSVKGTSSSCDSGTIATTYQAVSGSDTVFSSQAFGSGCADNALDGIITLKSAISSGDKTAAATFAQTAAGSRQDGGTCVAGTPSNVTIQINLVACDAGVYSPVCGAYASTKCVSFESQSDAVYRDCLQTYTTNFLGFITACKANTATASKADVTCLEGKASEVSAQLEALLAGVTIVSVPTCGSAIQGIGWLMCPVLTALGTLDDGMWNFVSGLLTVSPLAQTQTNPNGTTSTTVAYQIWGAFRSIADVALVIVFLLIIFSQLTSIGLSNLGVKKMLPRLIIAAILINVSFLVMQVAVDVANIAGTGLYTLMNGLIGGTPVPNWSGALTATLALPGVAVGAVGIAAIAPEAAVMTLIPGALAALIGFLAAVLTLIFRQAIIPILAVAAPLAFVAYLLPNTKSWFDKWRGLFVSMLLLFPLAAVLFAGTKMAAAIISTGQQWWQLLVALIVLGAPLFMLPFLARQAGPLLGKVTDSVKRAGSVLQKPIGNWADARRSNSMTRAAVAPTTGNPGRKIYQGYLNRRRKRDFREEVDKGTADAAWAGQTVSDPKLAALSLKQSQNQTAIAAAKAAQQSKTTRGMQQGGTGQAAVLSALGAGGTDKDVAEAVADAVAEATEKAIKSAEIKATAEIRPGDLGEMGRRFAQAISTGNTIEAQALQGMLLGSGAKGLNEWRSQVGAIEGAGSMDPEVGDALRRRMLKANPTMKQTDAGAASWATGGKTLAATLSDPATWSTLTNTEFAGQKPSAQHDALNSGVITGPRALEIQSNPQIFDAMDETVKQAIRDIAATAAGPIVDSSRLDLHTSVADAKREREK